jgi:hypothetical protein
VRRPRFAVAWLAAGGLLLEVGGAAAAVVGTWYAPWLHAQLPPLIIDAHAVGGAATASGAALLVLGALHLAAAFLVHRRVAIAATAVVLLAALMAFLALGWGVAALVSALSGSGPAIAMLPAGIGLGVVAIGYGWTVRQVMGSRSRDRAGS